MVNDLENYNITMSNALVRASHGLTLLEKRLIACCIARTDSRKGEKANAHLSEFKKIKITADEYAETFGIGINHAYEHLKNSADSLLGRVFTVKNGEGYTRYTWVSNANYQSTKGFIEVSFNPDMFPHLHALRSQYTTYKLKDAAELKTPYSWRMYEIARSWLDHCEKGKRVKIDLKSLFHQMGAPESYTWKDFRKRALDPSIDEILLKTNLVISYDIVKRGRAVNALEFVFSKTEKQEK